jgi:hypothetical protein
MLVGAVAYIVLAGTDVSTPTKLPPRNPRVSLQEDDL